MNFISASNPVWANPDNTQITLDVRFEEFPNPIPFTACPLDVEPHGVEIFNRASAGEFGAIGAYVPPPPPPQPVINGAQQV